MNEPIQEDFITFLEDMRKKIDNVHSIEKPDFAYNRLRELESDLRHGCVNYYKLSWEQYQTSIFTKNLYLSSKILDKYKSKESAMAKTYRNGEFKEEICFDLDGLINKLKHKQIEKLTKTPKKNNKNN